MKTSKYIFLFLLITVLLSCGKDEFKPYDHAFIHIMRDEISSTTVSSKANYVAEYKIYLSSKPLTEKLTVNYSISTGEGLQQGVDYELVNTSNEITFLPGIYDMPVRIRWKSHQLDSQKDNTLTIRIESNSMGLSMGLPGDDENQREFTITKIN